MEQTGLQENPALKKFDSLVKSFSGEDRIAFIPDLDADGLSSGALAFIAIKLLRRKEPDLVIVQPFKTTELLPKTIEQLRENKIGKLVIVDFAAEQSKDNLKQAESVVEQVLVIDHHKFYGKEGLKKTFILKAQDVSYLDGSKYPTSKLVFDLFSRHVNLEKFSWIASVGLMGDNQLAQWKGFVEKAAQDIGSSVKELGTVTGIISAVEVLAPEKLGEFLLFYVKSKNPREIMNSPFAKYKSELDSRVEGLFGEFHARKEVFDEQELVWFEFKSKDNIKSAVINKVSNELFPKMTVIFVQDKGDGYMSFSARRQDFKVKTNEVLETAVKGFEDAGAGGHIPASAGRIRKSDLPEFKKRVMQALSG